MTWPRVSPPTILLSLLAAFAFSSVALRPVSDPDVWWHLKAGDDLLSGRPGAFVESWSFTAAGSPWINHEWLAEWRFALARRTGGDSGVVVLTAFILAVTSLLLFRAARVEGLPAPVIALGLTFVPLVAGSRFVPRPQVYTYFFLALLLERSATARKKHRSGTPPGLLFLAAFPILQALWTNMHGPIVGLAVGSALVLGGGLSFLPLRRQLLVVVSLLLASIAHPQGIATLIEYSRHLAGGGLYNQTIREWLPLYDPGQSGMFESAATWGLVFLAAAFGIVGFRQTGSRRAWAYPLLLVLFAGAAVSSVRHRDVLAILFVPAASAVTMAWRDHKEGSLPGALGVPLGALAVFFVVISGAGLFHYPAAWPPRPRLDTADFPAAAADFLEREKIGSRIFNAYDYGGYLVDRLAPGHKVYIDGRYFVYGEERYRDYLEIRDGGPSSRGRLDAAGADLLLVRYPQPDGYQGLALRAREWPDWSLVFWDDLALLYVRNTAAPAPWLSAHAYRAMDPTLPPALDSIDYWRTHFEAIESETNRAAREAPDAVRPRLVHALACEYNGRDGDARALYRAIVTSHPGNRPAMDGLARIEARNPGGLPPAPEGNER